MWEIPQRSPRMRGKVPIRLKAMNDIQPWGGAINMWGKHLIIDMTAGEIERVQSAAHVSRFVETLSKPLA